MILIILYVFFFFFKSIKGNMKLFFFSSRRLHTISKRDWSSDVCSSDLGRIVALEGSDGLQSITVEANGTRKSIPASAVFVYVGQSPAAEFLPESLARDATGHIVVDAEGRTSAPTVFAVGDVRSGARHYLSDAIAD